MGKAKQPVSIDGIEFDALIEQNLTYEADVPEYPTEMGFIVSDSIVLRAETLSMTLYVTDTPVTWKNRFGSGNGRAAEVIKRLEELYFSKKLVSVITSDAVYSDMAITNLSFAKSTDVGYATEIPISFKKVVVTETATVEIPSSYGKSGKTKASAGTANTVKSSEGEEKKPEENDGSLLYNLAKGTGLIKDKEVTKPVSKYKNGSGGAGRSGSGRTF